MGVPFVRVPREVGEETRVALAEANLLATNFEIETEASGDWIYLPVTDPEALSGEIAEKFEIVRRDGSRRERQTTPAELLGFDPSYERLGDAVIIDEDDDERAREIARAIVESDLPVETVVNKASKVKGETRVREWDVLVGEGTETVHREYGCEFALDLATVYFSPRLATERRRVGDQVESGERAFDMFAGVGPYVIPFAKRGANCVGVDVNEHAIEYLRENARRNGVEDRVTAVAADVRTIAPEYDHWADRIVMNLPHRADEFLESARTIAGEDCVLHYYDIQHEDDPFGPGERAICEAFEPAYEVAVETRREVRSYAPHEVNVCLDVTISRS